MADYGAKYADDKNEEIVKRLKSVYRSAYNDLLKEFSDFTEKSRQRDEAKRKQRDEGKISDAEYQDWRKGQEFIGKQWQAKVNHALKILQNADKEALKVIDREKLDVFAENANHEAYQLEKEANLNLGFGVYDADAVGNLIREEPELLPRKVLDKKSMQRADAWNRKQIANAVTRGIIEGNSIDKIAKKIAEETASSASKAMVRYARTAVTGAQNAGRMDTLHRAHGMGIKVKKKWLATLDKRTRDSHAILDGQVRDIDKPFNSIYGEIMYPGDLGADSDADIWNCRCTLEYVYPDFEDLEENVERYDQEEGKPIEDMTYEEWKEAKHPDWKTGKQQPQNTPKKPQQAPAGNGWTDYKPDEYDSKYAHVNEEIDAIKQKYDDEQQKLLDEYQQIGDEIRQLRRDLLSTTDQAEIDRLDKELQKKYARRSEINRRSLEVDGERHQKTQDARLKYTIEKTAEEMKRDGVSWLEPKRIQGTRTDDEIISSLAGADKTSGSCASLAYAYVGQKAGYDVLDYRGGMSQNNIAHEIYNILLGNAAEGKGVIVGSAKSYITAGKQALKQVEEGHQYYFECACHAAIVKKEGGELYYLEMQSGFRKNTWYKFSDRGIDGTLNSRFGAPKSGRGYTYKSHMQDVEELAKDERFLKLLGYINTEPGKQMKGQGGGEK